MIDACSFVASFSIFHNTGVGASNAQHDMIERFLMLTLLVHHHSSLGEGRVSEIPRAYISRHDNIRNAGLFLVLLHQWRTV
jgi:hypothetical protein